MHLLKPRLFWASVNPSVKGTTNFTSLPSSFFLGGLVAPEGLCPSGQESAPSERGPWPAMPTLQPETSNYLWGGCCTQMRTEAQPSLNDTLPACPLTGVGGEGAWPGLAVVSFSIASGLRVWPNSPRLGWHRGTHSAPSRPNSGHHVLPISGIQKLPGRG